MNGKLKIAGLGEVLWDIYADQRFPGGAPANFAAHVSLAGHQGILLSRVGNDEIGYELLLEFEKFGVDVSLVQKDRKRPTGTVHVSVDERGIPSFECSNNVAFDYIQFDRNWKQAALDIDAVLFGTLAQRNEISKESIRDFLALAENATKIYDVNLRGWDDHIEEILEDSLYRADVLKMNHQELKMLKQAFDYHGDDVLFLRAILDEYVIDMAAITLGARGSFCVTEDDYAEHPGFEVYVDDTTGAGDAFAAGLAIKYLQDASLSEIAEFGNKLGALICTRTGAIPLWNSRDLEKINKIRTE